MASSSTTSRSWRYDVFPSFSGEDVRKSFLSHLLKEFERKLITTFIDKEIERSRPIGPELKSGIRESRISIILFSKKYASSTWCLNELVEIYKCYKEFHHLVIPIFYDVDPSDIRKQSGEFGKVFDETCKGKTEDLKQRWISALAEVASIAGEHSINWSDEAKMIEKISKDVLAKLITGPSDDDFDNYVGVRAHVDAIMDSKLSLESGGVRMVGIVGTSGIGKTTIARALYSKLSSRFDLRSFKSYKRTLQDRKIADDSVKLSWAKQLLSNILGQNNIEIGSLDVVKQRLKHKKVLIILDDVDEIELLEALVGQPEWFGFGSRIIVVTQDRDLLKSHKINLIYDVELPSEELAFEMFCRSAFRQNHPPNGFEELASEVVYLSGKLPLGVTVLGSSLREKNKEEWRAILHGLRNRLHGKIGETLRVSYNKLDRSEKDVFLYIACLFNGEEVNHIANMLGNDVITVLRILADRSLISIRPSTKTVEMHGLLEKLGRGIVCEESNHPGKRRILIDANDIYDVLTDHSGTESVLAIYLHLWKIKNTLSIAEKSFEGMYNLQFLKIYEKWGWANFETTSTPQGHIVYLPRKLRLLHWDEYPAKSLPSSFSGECLVELIITNSKLEKLWEGSAQPLGSLKKMILDGSNLKEIPDISNAKNLEILSLRGCIYLVELPSTIRNLKKLIKLLMDESSNLKSLPTDVNLESLHKLSLRKCSNLRTFPRISRNISRLNLDGTAMKEEDCLCIEDLSRLTKLSWVNCPLRCMPYDFHTEHLVELYMRYSKLEKLWEGVQPLQSLKKMDLHGSKDLKVIPDLSNATNLEMLSLIRCKSLVTLPPSIGNLKKLIKLALDECSYLEFLPTDINLESLDELTFINCSKLRIFPRISKNISTLVLSKTAIKEEEECLWIENLPRLTELYWRDYPLKSMPHNFHTEHLNELDMMDSFCLKKLWDGVQPLGNLGTVNLSGCVQLKEIPDLSEATSLWLMRLNYCKSLVTLPSSIGHLVKLKTLEMKHCINLEFLPTNINMASLHILNLNGCTRLTSFPQLSTSIKYLFLNDTAIEEVPSWIENISTAIVTMIRCKKLRKISATIKNLTFFHAPEIEKAVSYANLLEIVEEVHPASIQYYAENLVSGSYSAAEFLLARSAQDYILQTDFRYVVLPGKQVPTYFTHRTRGRSLILPLSESSLSKKKVEFAGCLSLDLETDYITIIVHWKFKGVTGICRVTSVTETCQRDHQVVFHFDFYNGEEIDDPPSPFDCSNVEFEFEVHRRPANYCRCYHLSGTKDRNLETCPFFTQMIKECGIRVMGVSPPLNADETSSEPKSREKIDPETVSLKRKTMMPCVSARMILDDVLFGSDED